MPVNMKTATSDDFQTEPFPARHVTIPLDLRFSQGEMHKIKRGLIPKQMEDKWFIYWEDDTLFFHRSWTGYCVYVVRFTAEDGGYRMTEADVNRDPEQYSETSDERDTQLISYLIDLLLLGREAVSPSDEPSSEKQALMEWSEVGRAMSGQGPNTK